MRFNFKVFKHAVYIVVYGVFVLGGVVDINNQIVGVDRGGRLLFWC